MNRRWLSRAALAAVLGTALLVIACSSKGRSREVNVLCSPEEEWCQGMAQAFETRYGVRVNYVRLSSGDSLSRLVAERDDPQFDIWWGGPIDSFVAAKQMGLLEPYESPGFENLRDQRKYRDPENYWVGIYIGTLGFCTNQDWLADHPGTSAPRSWADLLRPEFGGEIIMAHPASSGTAYTALASILQIKGAAAGWEYLADLAGQVGEFTESGALPAALVGQGRAAVCVVFSHDIVHESTDNGLPLTLSFPQEGTGYEIGGMGIVRGAKHLDAARRWFDWALTPEAQALGPAYGAYQAPTVKGVQLSHPELLEVNLIDYDFQWAGQHKTEFVSRFSEEIAPASEEGP
jgi:iron(III) transport system substrate-binding protein